VSPSDKFNAAKLLQSALQPSVPGASGQTASTASSGGTGWTMTTNPLQGLFAAQEVRYLPSSLSPTKGLDGTNGAWFLLEAKKSIVWQDRDALEVAQEAANTGESFDRDVYRYRVRRRARRA
jgi:phage major head subunit gpT-like protein